MFENNPLISVITPFLNCESWLPGAIESVISQTYSNWELILIDDGSKVEAKNIALSYARKYPGKITCIHHPGGVNKGVTISRNLGIKSSKGMLIALLDADDCWLPQKLDNQVRLFRQHSGAGMICEASIFWYSWNSSAQDEVVYVGALEGFYTCKKLSKILYPLGKGAPPCPTGIIFKRSSFDNVGGFEPSFSGEYQLYEDQAFLSKMYLNENIFISAEANNLYRKRPGSLTEEADNEHLYKKIRLYFLGWFSDYVHRQKTIDTDISQLVKNAQQRLIN